MWKMFGKNSRNSFEIGDGNENGQLASALNWMLAGESEFHVEEELSAFAMKVKIFEHKVAEMAN